MCITLCISVTLHYACNVNYTFLNFLIFIGVFFSESTVLPPLSTFFKNINKWVQLFYFYYFFFTKLHCIPKKPSLFSPLAFSPQDVYMNLWQFHISFQYLALIFCFESVLGIVSTYNANDKLSVIKVWWLLQLQSLFRGYLGN